MKHEKFQTAEGELNWNAPMYRLYEKAKERGTWNPAHINFEQDKIDYQNMTDDERVTITPLIASFSAGEEAVTLDILPMVQVMAKQGRLEDTMFLTTFIFDEAKHTELFSRWQREVGISHMDLSVFHNDNYKRIFYDLLPESMNRLHVDDSPEAIIRAATIYNMVVEGILAETGYHAFRELFRKADLLPGILQGIDYLNEDEGRHLLFGIYTIQRSAVGNDRLLKVFNDFIDELWADAFGFIQYLTTLYDIQVAQDWTNTSLVLDSDAIQMYGKKMYEIRKKQINTVKQYETEEQLSEVLFATNR